MSDLIDYEIGKTGDGKSYKLMGDIVYLIDFAGLNAPIRSAMTRADFEIKYPNILSCSLCEKDV